MKIFVLLMLAAAGPAIYAQNSTPENVEAEAAGLDAKIEALPPVNAAPPADSAAFKAPPYLPDYNFWPVSTPGGKPWYTNLWKSDPFAPGHRPVWAPAIGVNPPDSINDWPAYDNPEWYRRLILRFRARHPSEPDK